MLSLSGLCYYTKIRNIVFLVFGSIIIVQVPSPLAVQLMYVVGGLFANVFCFVARICDNLADDRLATSSRHSARASRADWVGHCVRRQSRSVENVDVDRHLKMGLSEETEDIDRTRRRFEDLCMSLNMDNSAKDAAAIAYERMRTHYTLEVRNSRFQR